MRSETNIPGAAPEPHQQQSNVAKSKFAAAFDANRKTAYWTLLLAGSVAGPLLRFAGVSSGIASIVAITLISVCVMLRLSGAERPADRADAPIAAAAPPALVQLTPAALTRQRGRSIAIALALVGLVALFYIATIVRLGSNVANRAL